MVLEVAAFVGLFASTAILVYLLEPEVTDRNDYQLHSL